MRLVIHQPNYFPYCGFFHKLTLADTLILMDNTQYDKKFTNRNRIIIPDGWVWISVPIKKEHKFSLNKFVEVNNDIPWRKEHWNKIFRSYTNAKFFKLYEGYFKKLYSKSWEFLFDLNFETLKQTLDWLGIKIKIIKESEFNVQSKSTERLVDLCKAVGAETYVQGMGGKGYVDEKLFERENIRLEYQNFHHPVYEQHFTEKFIPNLSVIDLLSNVGTKSLSVLTEQNEN